MNGSTGRRVFFTAGACLLFFSHSAHASGDLDTPVRLEVQFPVADFQKGPVYQQGVMGAAGYFGEEKDAALAAEVVVTNVSGEFLGPYRLEVTAGPHLGFVTQGSADLGATKKTFTAQNLAPRGAQRFGFRVRNPSFHDLPGKEAETFLEFSVLSEDADRVLGASRFPVRIKKTSPWAALAISAIIGLAAFAFLIRLKIVQQMGAGFGKREAISVVCFTLAYVGGSCLGFVLQYLGMGDVALQVYWAVYAWTLLLVLLRLFPRPGILSFVMIIGSIAAGLIAFGIHPLMLITYTLPGALVLELYFARTGYGRTFGSSFGSGLCYAVFPSLFFWVFAAPSVYYSHYSLPYVLYWALLTLLTYCLGGTVGFYAANRIERYLRSLV